jgi:hypothetical protein
MNAVDRVVTRYRALRYRRPALPRVTAAAGPVCPAALLRLAALAVPALTLVLAARRADIAVGFPVALAAALALWALFAPGVAVGWATAIATAFVLLASRSAPADPAVAWLAPLVVLACRLGGLAALAPWTSWVQWAVLATGWRRDLAVVAATEALLALALVATGAGSPYMTGLGAAALVALAWTVVPRPWRQGRSRPLG